MRILVTGSSGFIARNLIPKLEKLGHEVVPIDVQRTIHDDVRYLKSTDIQLCDVVVHLAAYGSVIDSIEKPQNNFSINVKGTLNMLNVARDIGAKFIFASTGGALFGDGKAGESLPPSPISPYGASKAAAEMYCSAYAHSYSMDITALRFSNVYGPCSEHKKGAVTKFIRAIQNDEPITIYGDCARDFVYVDDICDGIIAAMYSDLKGFHALHLAGGNTYDIKYIALALMQVSGKKVHTKVENERHGEVKSVDADFFEANHKIGYRPKVSIIEGLQKTWDWFNERT